MLGAAEVFSEARTEDFSVGLAAAFVAAFFFGVFAAGFTAAFFAGVFAFAAFFGVDFFFAESFAFGFTLILLFVFAEVLDLAIAMRLYKCGLSLVSSLLSFR